MKYRLYGCTHKVHVITCEPSKLCYVTWPGKFWHKVSSPKVSMPRLEKELTLEEVLYLTKIKKEDLFLELL